MTLSETKGIKTQNRGARQRWCYFPHLFVVDMTKPPEPCIINKPSETPITPPSSAGNTPLDTPAAAASVARHDIPLSLTIIRALGQRIGMSPPQPRSLQPSGTQPVTVQRHFSWRRKEDQLLLSAPWKTERGEL